jgi:hypothetical protein
VLRNIGSRRAIFVDTLRGEILKLINTSNGESLARASSLKLCVFVHVCVCVCVCVCVLLVCSSTESDLRVVLGHSDMYTR